MKRVFIAKWSGGKGEIIPPPKQTSYEDEESWADALTAAGLCVESLDYGRIRYGERLVDATIYAVSSGVTNNAGGSVDDISFYVWEEEAGQSDNKQRTNAEEINGDILRELRHLVRYIESLEWSETDGSGNDRCPTCDGARHYAHLDGCELAARLNGARAAIAKAGGTE